MKYLWLLLLTGCSTIVEGTSQNIRIESDPPAKCEVFQGERKISKITTPDYVIVDKCSKPIKVVCSFEEDVVTKVSKPGVAGATFGNILAGGVIGVMVDAGTGAEYKYDDVIVVKSPSE